MLETQSLQAELVALVGADHVRPATAADAIDGVLPGWVVAPATAEELAAVLRLADSTGQRVAPRGGGTKMGWGVPPRGADLVLATRRLDAVLEHAWGDMTVTVQAGCPVAHLQNVLAAHGQRLALDPLWPDRATVGGVLATNDSGTLRTRFGAGRDLIIGLTVALPDGTLAKSGGKVVKNVAGYDLPKLMTGALGTLGVITEAVFRLHPLPAATRAVSIAAPAVAPLQALLLSILDSALVPTGLQLRAGAGAPPALDVRFEGSSAGLAAALDELARLARAAGCAGSSEAPPVIWEARAALWTGAAPALVCKVSVLPAHLARLAAEVARVAGAAGLDWALVAQAGGVGLLRLEAAAPDPLPAALARLRALVEAGGGSLVVLGCPPALKAGIDVWGAPGDALPLMRRVKAQFDPRDTLNPGRFVGGI